MKIGQKYLMQRGPTKNPRKVSLLATQAPSGKRGWVQVRIEEGIGTGKVIEAPSQSIDYMPGQEPVSQKKRKPVPKAQEIEAPPGWKPKLAEAVAWTQTLGTRMEVIFLNADASVARLKGRVLGVTEEFNAPVVELAPFRQELAQVADDEVESTLGDRLPAKVKAAPTPEPKPSRRVDDGLVDRLEFDPRVIERYRRRFARSARPVEAERQLREELRDAKRVRLTGKEYLRLQVAGRFEVPLRKRPMAGDYDSCWVGVLVMAIQPKTKGNKQGRRRRRHRHRRAA
jgi:hypothetical protein